MRPLRLEMEAFGSFADRQEIDFEALGGRRLFLIHGPTGAGKSTILEAICFALYGSPTGGSDVAAATHLRSHHAEPDRLARVALDFALGEKRYRVERSPRQRRKKRRGEGFVEERGTATLLRFKPGAGVDDPGEPIATKQSDVDTAVRDLLGLDRAQFRQVILLPQGEFRKLLEATSKDRQDILTKLFDIDRYADLERRLKNAADVLHQELGGLERDRATLLGQAEVENEEAFELARKTLDIALTDEQKTLSTQQSLAKAASAAVDQAKADLERIRLRDEAQKQFEAFEIRGPEFKNHTTRLREAERAEPVALAIDRVDELVKGAAASRARVEEAKEAVEKSRTFFEAARNDEFAAREREPELRTLDEERARLRAARETVVALERLRAAQAEERSEQDRRGSELAEQRAALTLGEAAASRAEASVAELSGRMSALESRRAERVKLEGYLALKGRETQGLGRLKSLGERLDPANARLIVARRTLSEAEEGLRAAQQADQIHAAVRLAAALEDGEACPVCGGEEHPSPAHLREGASIIEGGGAEALARCATDLERLEENLSDRRGAVEAGAVEVSKLEGEHETETRGLAELQEELTRAQRDDDSLGGLSESSVQDSIRELTEQIEADEQSLVAASKAEEELAGIRKRITDLRGKVDALSQADAAGQGSLSARAMTITEREGELPAKVRSLQALDERDAEVATRHTALSKRIEETRLATQQAEAERARNEATEAERKASVARSLSDCAAADKAMQAALVAGGFESAAVVRESRIGANGRQTLREKIEKFSRERASAQARLTELVAAAKDASAADVEALNNALVDAEALRSATQDRVGELKGKATSWARLAASLAAQKERAGDLGARYERIGGLAKVASGENPQRVSFQRFVLAAFLDEVLALATVSLRRMSKGRYELRRVTEVDDKRRRAGLDLAVWDAHTGQERPVSTLSGGESFCAALALALGLAEVVQRHSGGTRLDAIFVDEGFGSLDPESLELALETLVELQSGGRLVGLISHVPELKERIDTRIEVSPGRGGSVLDFVVA